MQQSFRKMQILSSERRKNHDRNITDTPYKVCNMGSVR